MVIDIRHDDGVSSTVILRTKNIIAKKSILHELIVLAHMLNLNLRTKILSLYLRIPQKGYLRGAIWYE
jgi:hypothetical protein